MSRRLTIKFHTEHVESNIKQTVAEILTGKLGQTMQRFGDTLRPDRNEIGAAELLATINGGIKETTKMKTKEQEQARKQYEEALADINSRYK